MDSGGHVPGNVLDGHLHHRHQSVEPILNVPLRNNDVLQGRSCVRGLAEGEITLHHKKEKDSQTEHLMVSPSADTKEWMCERLTLSKTTRAMLVKMLRRWFWREEKGEG